MSKQTHYYYPNSSVLINRVDIREQGQLDTFEAIVTTKRITELALNPIWGRHFDFRYMCAIHRHIFQDIYPFAGKIREVNISKGNTLFAYAQFIEPEAKRIFDQLRADRHLMECDRRIFVERSAFYMAELNILHPFREGNGRTLREFIRCLGLKAGHTIDWTQTNRDVFMNASIQSVHDVSGLVDVMEQVVQ